jgi:ferredoxin
MSERWTVTVDRGLCQGTGLCASAAPRHFRLDDGRSRPVQDVTDPDDVLLDAAAICPTEAILISDAAGRPLAP